MQIIFKRSQPRFRLRFFISSCVFWHASAKTRSKNTLNDRQEFQKETSSTQRSRAKYNFIRDENLHERGKEGKSQREVQAHIHLPDTCSALLLLSRENNRTVDSAVTTRQFERARSTRIPRISFERLPRGRFLNFPYCGRPSDGRPAAL